jgi:hypothetical protein
MIAAVMRRRPREPNRAWGTPLRLQSAAIPGDFLDDFAIAVLV